jgi:hypothetical protein
MGWDIEGRTEMRNGDFHKSWVCPFCYGEHFQAEEKPMQMQEMLNQLDKRLPRDRGDLLFVSLALNRKPEGVQFREERQSSGATV